MDQAKKILITLTALIISANFVASQNLFYVDYDWDKKSIDTEKLTEPKTIIHNHEVVEFTFEGNDFVEYYFFRSVEHINHDKEIERNNRKYIPYSGASMIVDARARVIKPDDTSFELADTNILYSEDEETGRKYSFFALEGLENGDIVDFYYVIKKKASYHGSYVNIQREYPVLNYTFELLAPTNLIFAFDVKNDTNTFVLDTNISDYNKWALHMEQIEALKEEEDAPYGSLQKYLVYKLDKNIATSANNMVSYGNASQNIYNSMYASLEKSEQKALNKFMKKIDFEEGEAIDSVIRKIEDYFKTNITQNEYADNRFDDISFAISNKITTSFGMTKMLVNAYKLKGVEHELVITSDRTRKYFDGDFESFHNLDQYLIYFPETDNYLCADVFEYRYPLIPAEFADNKGLFIKEVSLGEFTSGAGKVKYINPLPYKSTHHNMTIHATIPDDFSTVELEISQSGLGYYGNYLQAFLDLISDDVYEEVGVDYLEGIMPDLESDDWEFVNIGAHNIQKLPLIFNCTATNKNLIEFAGNKYLFKVGDLIGPQVEMYSEDERKLPLHDSYKREFVRHIEITIPDGYTIKNPDDINIKTEFVKDEQQVLLFESAYEVKDNLLIIDINEYYDQLYYTVEEYPNYRDVVNSASDFNKVTLVLEKVE